MFVVSSAWKGLLGGSLIKKEKVLRQISTKGFKGFELRWSIPRRDSMNVSQGGDC